MPRPRGNFAPPAPPHTHTYRESERRGDGEGGKGTPGAHVRLYGPVPSSFC